MAGQEPKPVSPSNETSTPSQIKSFRAGTVPYLPARPLIYGLEGSSEVELVRAAPSGMRNMLVSGQLDVALLASIDLPLFGENLTILPAGCIAANGSTLIARIFSQVKAENLKILWADSNSHSALALVEVLWASVYQRRISVIPFDPSRDKPPPDAQAILLIGDRVVTHPPMGFDWQFDPSALWYETTGLPFVFAIWCTMRKDNCESMYQTLLAARKAGQENLEQIANQFAPAYGWPTDLAIRSLTQHIDFEFTEAHREGLMEFLEFASECKLIENVPKLSFYIPTV